MNLDSKPISSRGGDEAIPTFDQYSVCRVNRLYGTKEPAIITQTLLKAACYAQGPQDEAGKIARVEGIEFNTVKSLALNFQNILRIANLNEFTALTRLQLDNNIIEKIENLDNLVNLTWLDLSFNRITKIENLNHLEKLEDLSLFHNQIERIEGLDELNNLRYLSLGRNRISELENVMYLRKFKKLESLNLEGNPLTDNSDYALYTCAFIPKLIYLDYKVIREDLRADAYHQYQIMVDQMNELQKEQEILEEKMYKRSIDLKEHTNAFVDELEGDRLYELIMEADADGQKFITLPLVMEVLEQYKEKLSDICRMLFNHGLEEYQKRTLEEQSLMEAINEAKEADRNAGIKVVQEFLEHKRSTLSRLDNVAETQTALTEEILSDYRTKIHNLWDHLMSNEMVIAEQIEDVVKEFERNIRDMIGNFIETSQNYLSKCREAAGNFHERLVEATLPYAERLAKIDPNETEQLLFPDRETMVNCLAQSKDNQFLRIDECEEHLTKRANEWCNKLIEKIHREEELNRHLNRITEINLFVDYQYTELDAFDLGVCFGFGIIENLTE